MYCKHLAVVYCDHLPGVYCEQGGGDGVLDEQHGDDRLVSARPRAPVDEAGSGHFQRQTQSQTLTYSIANPLSIFYQTKSNSDIFRRFTFLQRFSF